MRAVKTRQPLRLRVPALLAASLSFGSAALAQAPESPPPATPPATPPADAPTAPTDARYAALAPITFHGANVSETLTVRPYLSDGTLDPAVLRQLAHLLRDSRNDEDSPLVARTIRLLTRVTEHFHASRIHIVSGFRSRRYGREGYHGEGSAIDFTLPGVSMLEVAAYARTLSHVGVGWYPRSNFVHLDSRSHSYFWIHRAGGRSHGGDRPLDRAEVATRDRAWSADDDVPWDPPGAAPALDLHPRVLNDAPRRHARRGRGHNRRTRSRTPLHVFQGRS